MLATDRSRVEFFGVRHHSPTAARLVDEHIAADPPSAVLIEGPADYNPHIEQLGLPHTMPVMLYAWAPVVADAEQDSTQGAERRSAFYPFTQFSPEWIGLQSALKADVPVEFIDLPWHALEIDDTQVNAYADGPRSHAVETLTRELLVDTFDAAMDELIEVDAQLDAPTYHERITMLGSILREQPSDTQTRRREAHMAWRIDQALRRYDGTVLVICGAAHIEGVSELLAAPTVPPVDVPMPANDDTRYGIALTPCSFAWLDSLQGYNAGQPTPGFYDALYKDRASGRSGTAERLLTKIVAEVRRAGVFVAAADLVAVLASARGIATLRGHDEVWRTDLIDGILSALIKDQVSDDHPLMVRVLEVMRGDAIGSLAPGSDVPPLTAQLRAQMADLDLELPSEPRLVRLDLSTASGRAKSQLLHSLTVLDVPTGTYLSDATVDGSERWELLWTPTFEGALVNAARYGGSRIEAVTTRLLGRAHDESDAITMVALIQDALMCGVTRITTALYERCEQVLATTLDLADTTGALQHLMQLYRYDPLLHSTGREDIGELVASSFFRVAALLQRVHATDTGYSDDEIILGIHTATDAIERVSGPIGLSKSVWDSILEELTFSRSLKPGPRGAALGARWLTQAIDDDVVSSSFAHLVKPADFGDFMVGLLAVAREAVLRRPTLLHRIDRTITMFDESDFFVALPSLRRAFSKYSMRERGMVAQFILGDDASLATQRFSGSPQAAAEVAQFEADVFTVIHRHIHLGVSQ